MAAVEQSSELDSATGLYYYRARWYDAAQARFIVEDPLEFLGGDANLYRYVRDNPIKYLDPSGTQIRSDRNWNEGDEDPITHKTLHNDFKQMAGMACALNGFNPWISAEGAAGFHLLSPVGGNASLGMKINLFTFEVCFYIRTCVRTGFGIYAGAGFNGGFNFGPTEGKRTSGTTPQLGFDAAVPGAAGRLLGRGGSGNVGLGGLGIGLGPTAGAGVSVGMDLCTVRIVCFNSPNCSCNSQ